MVNQPHRNGRVSAAQDRRSGARTVAAAHDIQNMGRVLAGITGSDVDRQTPVEIRRRDSGVAPRDSTIGNVAIDLLVVTRFPIAARFPP